jgi:hypothetical protein
MKSTPSRSGNVPRGNCKSESEKKAADENETRTF